MKRTGISMREIPYKTSAQIFTDVAAGRVDIVIDNVANILPILQGGRVRPLAVTTGERVSAMKATPTDLRGHDPRLCHGELGWSRRTGGHSSRGDRNGERCAEKGARQRGVQGVAAE